MKQLTNFLSVLKNKGNKSFQLSQPKSLSRLILEDTSLNMMLNELGIIFNSREFKALGYVRDKLIAHIDEVAFDNSLSLIAAETDLGLVCVLSNKIRCVLLDEAIMKDWEMTSEIHFRKNDTNDRSADNDNYVFEAK